MIDPTTRQTAIEMAIRIKSVDRTDLRDVITIADELITWLETGKRGNSTTLTNSEQP